MFLKAQNYKKCGISPRISRGIFPRISRICTYIFFILHSSFFIKKGEPFSIPHVCEL